MKYKTLPVKNVSRLMAATNALTNRASGLPGMGLIWGPTGYGKTTASAWMINQCNGVYIRAMRLWTPKSMLSSIAKEIEIDVKGYNNTDACLAIIQNLSISGRPLFIDEADYIVSKELLLDTLRDIHDFTSVPVILIGMHGIEKRIKNNAQFTGRIIQKVEFQGADYEDARLLADGLCEVSVADDLLTKLHKTASPKTASNQIVWGAEIRRLIVGLSKIEQFARSRGQSSIALSDWTRGDDFFVGAPVQPPKSKVTAIGAH